MSKGPWTRATKQMRGVLREVSSKEASGKLQLQEEGYMPRVEAAALVHKKAIEVADGPANEWVRVSLTIEVKKLT